LLAILGPKHITDDIVIIIFINRGRRCVEKSWLKYVFHPHR